MPPLNAMRAFEAAARLGSFAAAAAELCVTPGAIAQQIKVLETTVGVTLFDRHAQGVSLTDLGRNVLPDLQDAFDLLGKTARSLSQLAAPHVIKIAALPSIAQFWLSPRLPRLRRAVPGLEISVTTMQSPPNMMREPFDLSIFFEEEPLAPESIIVVRDEIFPVCAPEIAERLSKPAQLASETLLNDSTWIGDWNDWLSVAAPELSMETKGPIFSLFGLAIEDAKSGGGVLIGHAPLISQFLSSGELVAPFETKVPLAPHLCIGMASKPAAKSLLSKVAEYLSIDDNCA